MTDKRSPDLAERAFRRRRRHDAALVLPIFGVVIFITPIFTIFTKDVLIFGAPLPFLFIFGFWFLLILMALYMSRRLTKGDEGS
ncbi:MAG: hypothetical protein AAED33_06785 [Paracoccaceae bacterium]